MGNSEVINLPTSDESLNLYGSTKNLKIARQRIFIFNQINKLTIKIYSYEQYMNICYYLKIENLKSTENF